MTFENSFSPFPLCCPARASFLLGQYAHNHHVWWHDPPYGYGAFDDSRTIATSMHDAGYRTGFIGKYLNRYGLARSKVTDEPSARYVPNGWDDWRAAVEPPGDSDIHGNTYDYMDTPFNVNGQIDNRYRGVYQSDVIGDFSVAMAKRFAKQPKPFFMYVNYVAPHHGTPNAPDEPVVVKDENGHEPERGHARRTGLGAGQVRQADHPRVRHREDRGAGRDRRQRQADRAAAALPARGRRGEGRTALRHPPARGGGLRHGPQHRPPGRGACSARGSGTTPSSPSPPTTG
ncbi:sulfatase-like hydrolase/transferase [Nocardioides sp. W3-2-3]|nr:sulfatase-like hydrolase/transferase [Nocardioides convexus]